MKACHDNERCTYWQYKVANKECTLLSLCGFDWGKNYKGIAGFNFQIDRPKKQSGWIMGARKCQSIEDTKDDRGINNYSTSLIVVVCRINEGGGT